MMVLGGAIRGGNWNATNATLRMMIRGAYGADIQLEGQIVGPSWFDTDRFDVVALEGTYDIELETEIMAIPGIPANAFDAAKEGVSLSTALPEQLGLKLESERGPVEVLVMDSAEPPTPN